MISVVGTSVPVSSSNVGTSVVLNNPGVSTGNIMIAALWVGGQGSPVISSPPGGWAQVVNGELMLANNGDQWFLFVYSKIATASEPSTYTFTQDGGVNGLNFFYQGNIYAFSGTSGIDGSLFTANADTTSPATATGVTANNGDALLAIFTDPQSAMAFPTPSSPATFTSPSGWKSEDASNAQTLDAFFNGSVSAGATGDVTSATGNTDVWAAVLIALAPGSVPSVATTPAPPLLRDPQTASKRTQKLRVRAASNLYQNHDLVSLKGSPSPQGPTYAPLPRLDPLAAAKRTQKLRVRAAAALSFQHDLLSRTGSPSPQGPTWPQAPRQDVRAASKAKNRLVLRAAQLIYCRNVLAPQGVPPVIPPTWAPPAKQDVFAQAKRNHQTILRLSKLLYQGQPNQSGSPAPQGPSYPGRIQRLRTTKLRTIAAANLLFQHNVLSRRIPLTWSAQPLIDPQLASKRTRKLRMKAASMLYYNLQMFIKGAPIPPPVPPLPISPSVRTPLGGLRGWKGAKRGILN